MNRRAGGCWEGKSISGGQSLMFHNKCDVDSERPLAIYAHYQRMPSSNKQLVVAKEG
jgi:hypothetical protein